MDSTTTQVIDSTAEQVLDSTFRYAIDSTSQVVDSSIRHAIDSTVQVIDLTVRHAIDSTVQVMGSTIRQAVDSNAQAMDSTVRQIIDSSNAYLIDTITAKVIDKVEPDWIVETITTALIAGVVGFGLWVLQKWHTKKHRDKVERERFAKIWGLALFELSEAILRSFYYLDELNKGTLSHGIPYISKTAGSDFFKLNSNLSVGSKMHWMYALLNQIRENLITSRVTGEVMRSKSKGDDLIYAGAAAGFAKDHKDNMIAKFNFCLKEWRDFCSKHRIKTDIELKMLEQSNDNSTGKDESK